MRSILFVKEIGFIYISEDRENSICSHLVIFESGSLDDLCDAEDQETEGHEDDHQGHQEGEEAHWGAGQHYTMCGP